MKLNVDVEKILSFIDSAIVSDNDVSKTSLDQISMDWID